MKIDSVSYLTELFKLIRKAEAELGVQSAHVGLLLMLTSAACAHKSASEVADWLEESANDMRERIPRH